MPAARPGRPFTVWHTDLVAARESLGQLVDRLAPLVTAADLETLAGPGRGDPG
jgi:hypothetical protein